MKMEFTFGSRLKSVLFGMMGVGVVCLLITFFVDDSAGHPRFWSNLLHNSVFFTGIAFIALFLLCAKALAYSGWHSAFKRVWESYAMFLIVGLVLMLIIALGIFGGFHHLYHWADKQTVMTDRIIRGKAGFLNPVMYTVFTVVILSIWYFFATKIRKISLDEDVNGDMNFGHYKRTKVWAAAFLPIGGFTSAALVWQWVMSVDAHWYSTLFAWYATASWLVSMIALTILTLIYLKSKGYFEAVSKEHLHDLGKYLFGFSIFWTYLWFSQYMLIWYGNVGEETIYFYHRLHNYKFLFFTNLIVNFALPFLILLRNDTKRKYGTMVLTSIIVLFGHWLDFFLMLKPGILHTHHELSGQGAHASNVGHEEMHEMAHGAGHSAFEAGFTIPGFLELGTFVGFLGLFLYVFYMHLSKAPLMPKNDPYLHESYHHHV